MRRHVLLATSELAPWAKTGGLADVAAGLSGALARRGHDVRIVMPCYESSLSTAAPGKLVATATIGGHRLEVIESALPGVRVWQLLCPALYGRAGTPYGSSAGEDWPDNDLRFGVFGRAVAWLACEWSGWDVRPDVLHLNDWPSALAAPFVRQSGHRPGVLFTIHNLGYQGLFDRDSFDRLCGRIGLDPAWWNPTALEFHGRLSFIKAGLVFADRLSTVSPGYAREILTDEHGFGLGGLLRHRATDLRAILNGIDTTQWNPAADPHLPHYFDAGQLEGKRQNKLLLQRELGLVEDAARPLAAVVSRLVTQKGIDLVLDALPVLLSRGLQLAVLGTGERNLERLLGQAHRENPQQVAFRPGMNEPLAHRLEAGADIVIMASRYEPCGLNQLYSMHYGTIPVVRRTGGLGDTVDADTGFLFDEPSPSALVAAVDEALAAYHDRTRWRELQQAGMRRDFSWDARAAEYEQLYGELNASPGR
ncbi:MAG: glycogen synthase GlgA [Pseudomonadales bacterium]